MPRRDRNAALGAPAVEATDEFVQGRLVVLAAQPVVNTQGPSLKVGEDPVNPERDVHDASAQFRFHAADAG
jgi:hypothetical protein